MAKKVKRNKDRTIDELVSHTDFIIEDLMAHGITEKDQIIVVLSHVLTGISLEEACTITHHRDDLLSKSVMRSLGNVFLERNEKQRPDDDDDGFEIVDPSDDPDDDGFDPELFGTYGPPDVF